VATIHVEEADGVEQRPVGAGREDDVSRVQSRVDDTPVVDGRERAGERAGRTQRVRERLGRALGERRRRRRGAGPGARVGGPVEDRDDAVTVADGRPAVELVRERPLVCR